MTKKVNYRESTTAIVDAIKLKEGFRFELKGYGSRDNELWLHDERHHTASGVEYHHCLYTGTWSELYDYCRGMDWGLLNGHLLQKGED